MLDFQIPRITSESVEQNRGTFTIEPLDRGFGYTFGNSLRRVLLSSLAGAAVTSVRIEGVAHEFSTIQGVKEDVTDIVLNLKGVVCRMHSDASEVEAPLVVTGPGEITAKDIDLPAGVEILNPDLHIATLEKKTKLELYMTIGRGRGYRPAEENKSADQPIGVIPIDSIFSPVRRVAYAVEQARVGQKTDFDKLTLDIETDGSIDPQAALREAAELLISQLAIFTDADRIQELRATPGGQLDGHGLAVGGGSQAALQGEEWGILIEELELGVRSYNCLKRAGIQTVGDLISKSEAELNAIPNFGKKSIDEVIETLHRARPEPRARTYSRVEPPRAASPTDHAPPEDTQQAQPRLRAPQGAADEPEQGADRARADQDDRGQGQGGQAGDREADHARQARRPARAPPGAVDALAGQVRGAQAVRGGRAPLRGAPGWLHAHPQARAAPQRRDGDGLHRARLRLRGVAPRRRAGMITKLTIEYDGTDFAGWARQPGKRTVQEELERALRTVLGDTGGDGRPLTLTVAGRTDAGVHAWGQVASYAHEAVDPLRLNGLLDDDIAVLAAEPAPGGLRRAPRRHQPHLLLPRARAAHALGVRARARVLVDGPDRHARARSSARARCSAGTTSPRSRPPKPSTRTSPARSSRASGAPRASCSSSGSRRTCSCAT